MLSIVFVFSFGNKHDKSSRSPGPSCTFWAPESTHFAWNSYTAVYSSLCTQTNLRVTYSGQTGGWSESTLILTNQSQSKITRLIRVDQSQASKLVTVGPPSTPAEIFRNPRTTFEISNGGKRVRVRLIPKIVAYLSCSPGRTHFARTNSSI